MKRLMASHKFTPFQKGRALEKFLDSLEEEKYRCLSMS